MAKPRIFLSSTCYDLSVIRTELTRFLRERGFEVINSEDRNFGVSPGLHSHQACLGEVEAADYLLLLIGNRRGGSFIGSESSITNEEYKKAEKLGIPRIVSVQKDVWNHRVTYKKNPRADHSHVVDDVRIFSFIDYISSGHSDNWIHPFETIQDLKDLLVTQFAHYLTLFSRRLRRAEPKAAAKRPTFVSLPTSINVDDRYPDQDEAASFRKGLRALHKILKSIATDATKGGAKIEKLKQLWVVGRYGESEPEGERVSISLDRFKQYAWSVSKGHRVNKQFEDYKISADFREARDEYELVMRFDDADEETPIAWALKEYIEHLLKQYGDDAFDCFCRGDMRIYNR